MTNLRKALGFAALLLAGFAGAAVVVNPAGALSGDFLLGITHDPPTAMVGRNLTYTLEDTYQPADARPAITVAHAIQFSQPVVVVEGCGVGSPTLTELSCGDGPLFLDPGATATSTYVVAPTTPGALVATFTTYDDVGHTGSATDTVLVDPTPAGAHFVNGNVCCGQSLSTGTAVTATDPVAVSVQTPAGAGGRRTSIGVLPGGNASLPGFGFFGWQVGIEAAAGTPTDPLRLTFLLDGSLLPSGQVAADVVVTRNGAPAPDCDPSPPRPLGTAAPDPCVVSKTDLVGDDVELVVLTSQASVWEFAAVTVRGAGEQILDLVDKTLAYLDLPALEASLRARLVQAAADLVANKKARTCKGLNVYLIAVRFAPPGALSAAEKTELSGDVSRIKTVVGCT